MPQQENLPSTDSLPDPETVFSVTDTAYDAYTTSDLSWFDRDAIIDKELVQVGRYDQIWKCETDRDTVYLIEAVAKKNSSYNNDPNSNSDASVGVFFHPDETAIEGGRHEREWPGRETTYELAKVLGIPIPPHRFEDEWMVSVAGPGTLSEHRNLKGSTRPLDVDLDIDAFATDIAKLLAIGVEDLNFGNVLSTTEGAYCFIDVDTRPFRQNQLVLKGHYKVAKLMNFARLDDTAVYVVSQRAAAIAEWVHGNADQLTDDPEVQEQLRETTATTKEHLPVTVGGGLPFRPGTTPETDDPWVDFETFRKGGENRSRKPPE